VEEGRRFANEERDPMTSKELNEESNFAGEDAAEEADGG
jgi:hypothetical protein